MVNKIKKAKKLLSSKKMIKIAIKNPNPNNNK